MSTNKADAREAWIAKGDQLNLAVASAAHDNGYAIRAGAGAVNSDWYKILSDARKSLSDHLRTTPDGYVLVPVEPTPAMSDAAWRGFQDADFRYLRPKLSIHDVRRMFVMFYRTAAAWEGK